jgi:hypothetical protein
MTPLVDLWLPILLSTLAVFLISSLMHTVIPWHKNDFPKMPKEDAVMDALRPLDIAPGEYLMPRPGSMEEMRTAEFKEKMKRGPVVMLNVFPKGSMNMGKSMGLWIVYVAVIALFAAYIAGRALPAGAPYLSVFRFAGATTFISFSMALWQMSIWYNRPWSMVIKETVDGLIYALVTAGIFGWLWPH